MNEFIKTLTHGRKLQGALKDLTIPELEEVVVKLRNIIETRKQKESEKLAEEREKQSKIEAIQKQIEAAGITFEDLAASTGLAPSKRAGQKRPIKYSIEDKDGEIHNWTGIGRMPRVFAEQIENGRDLEEFSVNQTEDDE